MKKTISLIICMILLLSCCSCVSAAADDSASNQFEYETLADGSVCITKYTGSDESVVIPGELDGKRVKAVGQQIFADDTTVNGKVKELTLSEGIESIKKNAFVNARALEKIELPSTVNKIGDNAFKLCLSLKTIAVSEDNAAFAAKKGVLYSKDGKTLVCYPSGKTAARFTVPETVETVGAYSFYGARLSRINLGGVKTVGRQAFYDCFNLKSVKIPAAVTKIGFQAFGCGYEEECSDVPDFEPSDELDVVLSGFEITGLRKSAAFKYYMTVGGNEDLEGRWSFNEIPALTQRAVTLSALTGKKNAFFAEWKKLKDAQGYQLQYSTKKSFADKKTVRTKKTAKAVKELKSGSRYYVRVRAFKTVNGKKHYSQWSAAKRCKIK